MNTDELKSRLRGAAPLPQARADCPADETLASYVEGGMSESDHAAFEWHLADCGWCMARVGMLGRARQCEPEPELPEFTLSKARRIVVATPPARSAWRRQAPRWAAAAVVVIALSMGGLELLNKTAPIDLASDPTVRNIEPLAAQPRLVWPTEGAVIGLDRMTIEWSPVAETLYYQVRIVTDAGDLVWQEQLPGTQWNAPPELQLTPGSDYFIRVDAFLTETKTMSSDYVAFRLEGAR